MQSSQQTVVCELALLEGDYSQSTVAALKVLRKLDSIAEDMANLCVRSSVYISRQIACQSLFLHHQHASSAEDLFVTLFCTLVTCCFACSARSVLKLSGLNKHPGG